MVYAQFINKKIRKRDKDKREKDSVISEEKFGLVSESFS